MIIVLAVMINAAQLDAARFAIKVCATIRSRLGIRLPQALKIKNPSFPAILMQRVMGD
jgi:hypothetical protein